MPSSPNDVLLSESDSDAISSHFRSEQWTQVARDLNKEDEELRHYIETGNLNFWVKDLLSSAKLDAVPGNNDDRHDPSISLLNTPGTSNKRTLSWL